MKKRKGTPLLLSIERSIGMNFKELMLARDEILQGITKHEEETFKRMEEEHYEKILKIIKEQAQAIKRDA